MDIKTSALSSRLKDLTRLILALEGSDDANIKIEAPCNITLDDGRILKTEVHLHKTSMPQMLNTGTMNLYNLFILIIDEDDSTASRMDIMTFSIKTDDEDTFKMSDTFFGKICDGLIEKIEDVEEN